MGKEKPTCYSLQTWRAKRGYKLSEEQCSKCKEWDVMRRIKEARA